MSQQLSVPQVWGKFSDKHARDCLQSGRTMKVSLSDSHDDLEFTKKDVA
ncbi:hypothetical protein GCM10025794_31010 [Massilia kyonggiensis]